MTAPVQVVPEGTPQAHAHARVSPVDCVRVWGGAVHPLGHDTWPGSTMQVAPNAPPLSGTHVPGLSWQAPAPADGTVHTVVSTGGVGGTWADAGKQYSPWATTCENA